MPEPSVVAAIATASAALIIGVFNLIISTYRVRSEFTKTRSLHRSIRSLLKHRNYALRSFGEIQSKLAGFEEDELRQLLVGAGAVCFQGKQGEMWGLLQRNKRRLEGKTGTRTG